MSLDAVEHAVPADPNLRDSTGATALHTASFHNRAEFARLLLENGASPNFQSRLGGTALMNVGSRGETLPPDFDAVPLGDGAKTNKRRYSPRIRGERSWGATLAGEAEVSRARLRSQTGVAVEGFRGPPSSRPVMLDEALARAGYLYDAGLTAAEALTHRPFLMPARRGFEDESPVIALPTGLPETAAGAPAPSQVLALLGRVATHEGVLSWDLRPDPAGLAALKGVLAGLPAGTVIMPPGEAARRAFSVPAVRAPGSRIARRSRSRSSSRPRGS